jgi:hypothetical protein
MTIHAARGEILELQRCITWLRLDLRYVEFSPEGLNKLGHEKTAISGLVRTHNNLKALITQAANSV